MPRVDSEDDRRAFSIACSDYTSISACWHKTRVVSVLKRLVETFNATNTVAYIARSYESVNTDMFCDDLSNLHYELLFDPSAEINGRHANMKTGEMKSKTNCMRKLGETERQRFGLVHGPDMLNAMTHL